MTGLAVSREGHVAVVEICRPPNNFFDKILIRELAATFEQIDADPGTRSILLCSQGRNFCAGADFTDPDEAVRANLAEDHIYQHAVRLFRCETPVVAAVQGAAVGGGLGLSLVADFRVVSAETRFIANFSQIGLHPGFGLTVTLPRVVGTQRAALMFYTGRRIGGVEAREFGLADVVVQSAELRDAAMALAAEIARAAPLAVVSRTGLRKPCSTRWRSRNSMCARPISRKA